MAEHLDVDGILSALTLEEKASLCLGSDFWHTAPVERLGIPAVMVTDGPHGLRKQPDGRRPRRHRRQRAGHLLPDRRRARLVVGPDAGRARSARRSATRRGRRTSRCVLGPGINIKRSPLCGRNFEYFSEDPLARRRARRGARRGHAEPGRRRLAQALRGQQPGDRPAAGQRRRRRAHAARDLPARASSGWSTEAQPWTVMCAYNRVNGIYASQHHWLLTEVLRDEWGFDGLVVSDWGAVHDRVAALAAGLDLEMPPHLGVSDARDRRRGRVPARSTRRCSTRAVAPGAATRRRGRRRGRDRRRRSTYDAHHALARARRAASARCC